MRASDEELRDYLALLRFMQANDLFDERQIAVIRAGAKKWGQSRPASAELVPETPAISVKGMRAWNGRNRMRDQALVANGAGLRYTLDHLPLMSYQSQEEE